jgi:hypothetical protein
VTAVDAASDEVARVSRHPSLAARGDRIASAALLVGWVVVALVPLASAASTARDGWVPNLDSAMIAAYAIDSLGTDPPLVGMPTSLGFERQAPVHHLGPLGFWALAVPARLFGAPGDGLLVGAALASGVATMMVGLLLRRRRERVLEALLLAATAAMVVSLGGDRLSDPLNPYMGVMPTLLFLVAAWGVLLGRAEELWVVVLAGSFAAQVHLGYVPLVVAVGVVVVLAVAVDVRQGDADERKRLVHRIVPAALAVGALAWVAPILDQVAGRQNLTALLRAQVDGDHHALGLRHGLDVLIQMTSVPPWWLQGRAGDEPVPDASAARTALSVACLALAVALAAWAVRRRDRVTATLGMTSLVAVAAAAVSSSRLLDATILPEENMLAYRLFWWPAGVLFTAFVVWAAGRAIAEWWTDRPRAPAGELPAQWVAAGLAAVVIVAAPLGHNTPEVRGQEVFGPYVDHARAVDELPGDPSRVALTFEADGAPHTDHVAGFATGLVAQLRLRRIAVRFVRPEGLGTQLGPYGADNAADGDEDALILYRIGPEAARERPVGFRRISLDVPPDEWAGPYRMPSAVYVRDTPYKG